MDADRIIREYSQVKTKRGIWENHWREIAQYVFPMYEDHFNGNYPTPGEKRTEYMLDSTAALGLERFAAAMESMLTPRNGKWHILKASDPDLMKDKEVALWFERKTNLLFQMRYASRANFASQQHESYMQMGAFGTGALYTGEALDTKGFRYRATSISNIYFIENFQGIIDKAYRRFLYTAEQAAEHFGKERVSDEINKALEKDPQRLFEFVHVVYPNNDLQPEKIDFRGKNFTSKYVEVDQKNTVLEEGFGTFPYSVNRYVVAAGETYGRSPAMLALPSIKTLNKQKEHILLQGEFAVSPTLLTHDDGIIDNVDVRPNAIISGGMSPDGRKLVAPLDRGSNLAVGYEMMQQEQQVINDAFLVSLFQILVDTPAMTATEVLERAREKGALLSPTMGRQESEALSPLIEREIDILAEQGYMDDMPQALVEAEGDYEIVYDSPLSRSMKAEEVSGLARYMEMAAMHAQATGDPSMFDHLNPDTVAPAIADVMAVPASYMRSQQDIEDIRQSRAEQQQVQQAVEAAPAVAGLMKGAG